MEETKRNYLIEAYQWSSDTTFKLLHSGENKTYVVETIDGKYALRRYRPGRYTLEEVSAEIAWIDTLSGYLNVPRIIENSFGDHVSIPPDPQTDIYVVSEFVEGDIILSPTESDYQKLGRLMRCLHAHFGNLLVTPAGFYYLDFQWAANSPSLHP